MTETRMETLLYVHEPAISADAFKIRTMDEKTAITNAIANNTEYKPENVILVDLLRAVGNLYATVEHNLDKAHRDAEDQKIVEDLNYARRELLNFIQEAYPDFDPTYNCHLKHLPTALHQIKEGLQKFENQHLKNAFLATDEALATVVRKVTGAEKSDCLECKAETENKE